jgi:CHASE3 domain sensor protein
MFTHGTSAWDELIRMQGKIRKQRQEQIYAQQEAREKLFNIVIIVGAVALIGAMLGYGGYWIFQTSHLFAQWQ